MCSNATSLITKEFTYGACMYVYYFEAQWKNKRIKENMIL